jgi:hypothetical protein
VAVCSGVGWGPAIKTEGEPLSGDELHVALAALAGGAAGDDPAEEHCSSVLGLAAAE